MRFILSRGKRGFSLIEVVVALSIISVGFGGLIVVAGRTLNSVSVIRQDLIAANLGQEGIELVRYIRDTNWIEGKRSDGDGSAINCDAASTRWRQGLCDQIGALTDQRTDVTTVVTVGLTAGGDTNLLRLQLNGTYTYEAAGSPTPFRRIIELSTASGTEMIVRSIIRWCPAAQLTCSNQKSLVLEDRLFNWFPE